MMNKFGSELREFIDAKNISIKEFAFRLDISSKHLIDILDGNVELSQNVIYNIAFITSIPVSYIENVENSFKLNKRIDDYLDRNGISIKEYINRFQYKLSSKLYNFPLHNSRNDYMIAQDILRYLKITSPELLGTSDNAIFYKSKNDKKELLALFLEHCYRVIEKQTLKNIYNKDFINVLVDFIKLEAYNNSFDKDKLINKFNECGIFLAIEEDLPGSKIRGAFKVLNDKPAIFITKKYKRYADIYFALLHELAHCKSDFNRAKSGSIVSVIDDNELEDYEVKADTTALNWMVSFKDYEIIKNNLNNIDYMNYAKSFVVYRLALDGLLSFDSKEYQNNNKIIESITLM